MRARCAGTAAPRPHDLLHILDAAYGANHARQVCAIVDLNLEMNQRELGVFVFQMHVQNVRFRLRDRDRDAAQYTAFV